VHIALLLADLGRYRRNCGNCMPLSAAIFYQTADGSTNRVDHDIGHLDVGPIRASRLGLGLTRPFSINHENWAGSRWGLPPSAPTDPDVRVEGASGSSRCGFAVPLTTHQPRGDTLGGSMPSAWFRPPVHNAVPPSLPGVREGPFPRFGTTMRHCNSLTP